MPDGFDPHKELARIYSLREVMQAMQERAPTIIAHYDAMLAECSSYTPMERLAVLNLGLDRGYGKARQQHVVHVDTVTDQTEKDKRVKLYLPDNGRGTLSNTGRIIDA